MTRAEPWYRASFGEDYLEVYAHRDDRQGSEQARAVVRLLGLAPGARVLDVACGAGRHAFALREIGIEVIGVDLSPALLRAAVRRARDAGASSGGFVRGDMRHLPFRATFDAAISLFTSFGYFAEDRDNEHVLREVRSVLRPGGVYLLDFLNPDRVRATLEPRSEETRDGRRIVQERSLSPDGTRVEKTIRISTEGEPADRARVFRESVRLYSKDEIGAMFAAAGLEVTAVCGSFDGEPWDRTSERTIFAARRPSGPVS